MPTVESKMTTEVPQFSMHGSVGQLFQKLRQEGLAHKVLYFYVTDENGVLEGVVPVRSILTHPESTPLKDLMIPKPLSVLHSAPLDTARRLMVEHEFLGLPVVDANRQLLGAISIEAFTENLGDLSRRTRFSDLYTLLGVSASSCRSPWNEFKTRFPWLFPTLLAGLTAAWITSLFATTLEETIALAFFLTLVLGLNESVAMQSTSLTVQRLNHGPSRARSFVLRELGTGFAISGAAGFVVGSIAQLWQRDTQSSLVIGLALALSIAASNLWGFVVPQVLSRLKVDIRVAAAPLALGLADVSALTIYFGLAKYLSTAMT